MPAANTAAPGKYRSLLVAITLFVLLDLGVYVSNFLISDRIDADAARINNAGRLRGYSQQLTKALLTLEREVAEDLPPQTSLAQLSEARIAFNEALAQARRDAARGGDGDEVALLEKIEREWRPLDEAAAAALAVSPPVAGDVQFAAGKATARNVRLMYLADDLGLHLEAATAASTRQMRRIQSAAVVLAFLNFLFIVFKTLTSLRAADRAAEAARWETERILGTVREGLFLLDRDGRVGGQRSRSMDTLFQQPMAAGEDFFAALGRMVSAETLDAAREYIDLLFNDKVKATLLESLNPLVRVPLTADRGRKPVYLTFSFSQVHADGRVAALLVTVFDVSQETILQQELAGAEERANTEVELLLGVLENDRASVFAFLDGADANLGLINDALRQVPAESGAYAALVARIFRVAHSLKGEAAALALATVARSAHRFEDMLSGLRNRHDLAGDDFIPVATGVGDLLAETAKVRAILARIARFVAPGPAGEGELLYASLQRIHRLALSVAEDMNKKVRVETAVTDLAELPPAALRLLNEGLPQLVRNAVVHGIEAPAERLSAGKQPEGHIRIELRRAEDGGLELSVADDGRGIDAAELRHRLVASGRRSAGQVAAMADREVVAMIFEPGFSTAPAVSDHAGRGVGLDVLNALVRETGARLRLSSAPNCRTCFTLQWKGAL